MQQNTTDYNFTSNMLQDMLSMNIKYILIEVAIVTIALLIGISAPWIAVKVFCGFIGAVFFLGLIGMLFRMKDLWSVITNKLRLADTVVGWYEGKRDELKGKNEFCEQFVFQFNEYMDSYRSGHPNIHHLQSLKHHCDMFRRHFPKETEDQHDPGKVVQRDSEGSRRTASGETEPAASPNPTGNPA